ncbi:MAG: aminotransferase class I/II-fold pyridoxal phosphate-dependent enzyme, partial [Candidatus Limnocylindrales bacterium]
MTDAARRTGTTQVYTWEPSDRAIAARYGVRPEDVVRFDTNTSPAQPDWLGEVLAGPFDPPLNEYPDSEYEELTAAIADYVGVGSDEIVVGCGADEILDLVAKAMLPAGSGALVPVPTYGMYGVLTSQRAARVVVVPRLGPEHGFALDIERVAGALADVAVAWLCDPNNPTGALEPAGTVEAVLEAAAR